MITVRNQKLIKRSIAIGRYTSILSIVILGLGMYISIRQPDQLTYSLIALVTGFTLSQVGIYYSNRFSRSPRPDEQLDNALKGLDDSYALYHYQSPVSHLLVGPSGVWILQPYDMRGKVIYREDKKRWQVLGGSPLSKLFSRESVGRPDQDVLRGIKSLEKEFSRIPEFEIPEIKAALVFTSEAAEVKADNAPIDTLHGGQLKKLVRRVAKGEHSLSTGAVKTIQDHLGLVSNE